MNYFLSALSAFKVDVYTYISTVDYKKKAESLYRKKLLVFGIPI
ncbi:hypothetical protein LCGC14_1381330 [marine sediment metagenome]|uniref:Uncharacterized protein n=1 Tax=marine sediment metagenome TaxID=412755 RepID=A0A0F9MI24_9ZZZZ